MILIQIQLTQRQLMMKLIIWIGANDLTDMCDTNYSNPAYDTLKANILTTLENGLVDLIAYGMLPSNIYMVDQADRTQEQYCSNAPQFQQMVAELNSEIATWESTYGIHVLPIQNAYDNVDTYGDLLGDIVIDGHTLSHQLCDAPNCKYVADGHHNTAIILLTFNALFSDVLQVPQISDQRIAEFAELE